MTQLKWDELDFLEYLEVEAVIDDYTTSHNYELKQSDLRLLITVWQYESVVQVSLLRATTNVTIFSFAAFAGFHRSSVR